MDRVEPAGLVPTGDFPSPGTERYWDWRKLAIDTKFSVDTAIDEILISGTAERVVLPDAAIMFQGAYTHQGPDLVIEGTDGSILRVVDYYHSDSPADLYSETGAVLTADVVGRLVGAQNPLVFAQSGNPAGREPIGQVETLEGTAFATRANGQKVELNVGDPVFEDDLVETTNDSILGLTFIDETVFSLSANARMILDELVYEPNGNDNSMVMNLVEGTFVFVTGQVAPSGEMSIETPVATMGIRGTTPIVIIEGQNGDTEFGILRDPDGKLGEYAIFDKITKQVIGRVVEEGTILQLDQVGGTVNTIDIDPARLAERAEAQSNAYFLHTVARERLSSQQQNDNQPGDGTTPPGDGSPDPITTESIGDQSNLKSSGLNQFAFDLGNGLAGDSSGFTTGSSDSGSTGSGPQTAGSAQSPGTFVQTNTPPTTFDQTFQLSEDVEIAQAGLSVADGSGSLIYTITRQPDFGAVVVNADGTFTYIADPIFNILQQGESASISFDFQVEDSAGAVSNASTVTLQILGVNDAPVATAIDAGTTDEDAGTVAINLLATTLDPDTGDDVDTQNVAVTSSNAARSIIFTIDNETGLLTLDSAQFKDLGANESETLSVAYTIVDSNGGSTTNTATLTVNGVDDLGAVITGATSGTIVEEAGIGSITGNVAAGNVVTGDLNATGLAGPDDSWTVVGTATASDSGFGTFTINATGVWAYTLDNTNPTVDALNIGGNLTDTFTVTTAEGDPQTVTITINGVNDTASINGLTSENILEGDVDVTGDLDSTDVDNPDDAWIVVGVATASDSGFGTFVIDATGNWTYTLDNANPSVIDLNGGDTLPDSFTVQTVDGTSQTVSITIDGYGYYYYSYSYLTAASGEGSPNGDGFENVVVADSTDGNGYVIFDAERVAVDGDALALVNLDGGDGDGFEGLIVNDPNDAADGKGHIVYGGTQFAIGMLDAATREDGEVFSFESVYAGDVNGDGIDDLIIGDAETGEDSYVVFGSTDDDAPQSEAAVGDMDLSLAELGPVVDAAIDRWAQAGLSAEQVEQLQNVTFEVADLQGDQVGAARDGHIILDADAAGHGWFIDSTPFDDSEFTNFLSESHLVAEAGQDSAGGIDLLTTVLHEFGHELGLDHTAEAGDDLLFDELTVGERRLPDAHHAEEAAPVADGMEIGAAPVAGDDGKAGEFRLGPGESIDILVSALLDNDSDPGGEHFDLTGIFEETAGTATLEQVGGETVVRFTANAEAGNGETAGFQYEITNESGGVGFAAVDIIVDDMSSVA